MKSYHHENRLRARDLGVFFEGTPGPYNAITDVSEVSVGYTTLVKGEAKKNGNSPAVRTGVTAIFPRGLAAANDPVFAGYFSFNGNGEMTGTHWIDESGFLEGPITLTNTHSVGVVRDAVIKWQLKNQKLFHSFSLPVVAETCDGYLNDLNGFHISEEDVYSALDGACSGQIAEGNVGGGTGMCLFEWKGGTGTSSRKLNYGDYSVGVLVQANFGLRSQAIISGIPVGKLITGELPTSNHGIPNDYGASLIVVIATDVPLVPHQLKRLAKRASLGMARTGGMGNNSSGDIFIAFSTANPHVAKKDIEVSQLSMLSNKGMDELMNATIYATEEAIINTLIAAQTTTGLEGRTVYAIPHKELQDVLKKHNVLREK